VVGIGPGNPLDRTRRAEAAITASSVLMGYAPYLDSVVDLWGNRSVERSGMRKEIERCREALARARAGEEVALLCSGDAGVYGMAGLVLELAHLEPAPPPIEIIPGVTAANAAAASVGAPLMLDYAVLSLSDLLVPWDRICHRLDCLARADLPVALYNPKSKGRTRQIEEAREIFLAHRPASTPVAVVTAASTEHEVRSLSDLGHFLSLDIGMRSVVLVCGSDTRVLGDLVVAPRGYAGKEEF
jgi:precorrin-3B C17-methyltransferase